MSFSNPAFIQHTYILHTIEYIHAVFKQINLPGCSSQEWFRWLGSPQCWASTLLIFFVFFSFKHVEIHPDHPKAWPKRSRASCPNWACGCPGCPCGHRTWAQSEGISSQNLWKMVGDIIFKQEVGDICWRMLKGIPGYQSCLEMFLDGSRCTALTFNKETRARKWSTDWLKFDWSWIMVVFDSVTYMHSKKMLPFIWQWTKGVSQYSIRPAKPGAGRVKA